MSEQKKKWELNVEPNELTLQERKDAMLFLGFLNNCNDYDSAINSYKQVWLNIVYELPNTSDKSYGSVKQVRCLALKRIKTVFDKYIIQTY